jgi:hypothetical protein
MSLVEQEIKNFQIYLTNYCFKLGEDEMNRNYYLTSIKQLNDIQNEIKIFLDDMNEIKKKYILYIDNTKRYKKISDEWQIKDRYQYLLRSEKRLYKDWFDEKSLKQILKTMKERREREI